MVSTLIWTQNSTLIGHITQLKISTTQLKICFHEMIGNDWPNSLTRIFPILKSQRSFEKSLMIQLWFSISGLISACWPKLGSSYPSISSRIKMYNECVYNPLRLSLYQIKLQYSNPQWSQHVLHWVISFRNLDQFSWVLYFGNFDIQHIHILRHNFYQAFHGWSHDSFGSIQIFEFAQENSDC